MFFLIYVACALYLWLLGVAVFGGCEGRRSLFHAPWLGYAALIGCLQIVHLFAALDSGVSWTFLAISSLLAAGIVAIRFREGLGKRKETRNLPLLAQLALLFGVAWLVLLPAFNIHLFLCFASFLAAKDDKAMRDEFVTLLILAALSLTVKLNSAFFVATMGLLALIVLIIRAGAHLLVSKQVLLAALMAAAIFLPWVFRGVVISGYPLFPSTMLGPPVAWKVPDAVVSHFYNITVYWGRQPYYDLEKVRSGFAWVPEWLQRNWQMKDQFERPLILGAVWSLLLAILAWRVRNLRKSFIRLLVMVGPVAVSLVMWFFTAPDPRYLGSITWLLPLAVPLCLISETSLLSSAFIGLSLCINYAALGNLRYNTMGVEETRTRISRDPQG